MKPGNYGLGTELQGRTLQIHTKAGCSRKSPAQAQHPSSSQTSFATVCPARLTNGTNAVWNWEMLRFWLCDTNFEHIIFSREANL